MTSAAANANQSLYLARILLAAWRSALGEETVPALRLQQAFLPGVRTHLINAYGWFLLEIVDTGTTPPVDRPPRGTSDLPEIPEGKAESGELRECRQLEQAGWLAELLSERETAVAAPPRMSGNLATPAQPTGDYTDFVDWSEKLEEMMTRMRDSLDEY